MDVRKYKKDIAQQLRIPYRCSLGKKSCRFKTISSCHNISFLFGVEYILSVALTSDYIQKVPNFFLRQSYLYVPPNVERNIQIRIAILYY